MSDDNYSMFVWKGIQYGTVGYTGGASTLATTAYTVEAARIQARAWFEQDVAKRCYLEHLGPGYKEEMYNIEKAKFEADIAREPAVQRVVFVGARV